MTDLDYYHEAFTHTIWSKVAMLYLLQSFFAKQFVMSGMCGVSHVFHICSDQHFPEFGKIAMVFIFDCNEKFKM